MGDFDKPLVSTPTQVWLPGSDVVTGGVLGVDGEAVVLRVSPHLIPPVEFAEPVGGVRMMAGRNRASDDMTILLRSPTNPHDATIWHGHVTLSKGLSLFSETSSGAEGQTIESGVLILGSHLPNPQTTFSGVQIDATNLADWAQMPSVAMDVSTGAVRARWSLEPPEPVQERLVGLSGTIRLHGTHTFGVPTAHGFMVETGVRATLGVEEGLTLTQIKRRLVRPIIDLLEVLSAEPCNIRLMAIKHEQQWLDVRGHGVSVDAERNRGKLLLTRSEMGLQAATSWVDLHARVSPVGQIIASAWSGDFSTVDVELLTLATAAEGLHSALYPDERRFTDDELTEACTQIELLNLPLELAASIKSARQWWGEVSFPSRIQALADPVVTALTELPHFRSSNLPTLGRSVA